MPNYDSININKGYAFLSPESEEWHTAWAKLSSKINSLDFEGWQYMSTEIVGWSTISGRSVPLWMHQFRNRDYQGRRVVINAPVSIIPTL